MPQTPPYDVSSEDLKRLENDYRYHRPTVDQVERYSVLREMFKQLAFQVLLMCPPSRERSIVLTELNQINMTANAAIARNEPEAEEPEQEVFLMATRSAGKNEDLGDTNFAPILREGAL